MSTATYNPNRPHDDAIVRALVKHFDVHASVIVAWLKQVDLRAVTNRIADNRGVLPAPEHADVL